MSHPIEESLRTALLAQMDRLESEILQDLREHEGSATHLDLPENRAGFQRRFAREIVSEVFGPRVARESATTQHWWALNTIIDRYYRGVSNRFDCFADRLATLNTYLNSSSRVEVVRCLANTRERAIAIAAVAAYLQPTQTREDSASQTMGGVENQEIGSPDRSRSPAPSPMSEGPMGTEEERNRSTSPTQERLTQGRESIRFQPGARGRGFG